VTTLQTADRVLAALFLLADEGEVRPSRVAQALKVSKATAFNLLRTLEKHGLTRLNPDSQRYAIGPAIHRLTGRDQWYFDLLIAARPEMEQLRDRVNETVTLHMRMGRERVCVERFESHHMLRRCASLGERWPLNTGATGMVLMAWEPPTELDRLFRAGPLLALTPRTITNIEELRAALAQVRAHGYAIRMEDPVLGVGSISAPVNGPDERLAAALTISGPMQRWTEAAIHESLPDVLNAARHISRALAHPERSGHVVPVGQPDMPASA